MDFAKFILAVFVVAIHVRPFSGEAAFFCDDVIAQMADPLFFVMTAYFFFRKVLRRNWEGTVLGDYMKRIGLLYGLWVLLYSPVILMACRKEAAGLWVQVWLFLQKIFLSGPYGALWFLTALLLAMPLTFFVAKRWGSKVCLLLATPFYLFTAAEMSYRGITEQFSVLEHIRVFFESIFAWLANGLTYAFFFCALGLLVAEQERAGDGDTGMETSMVEKQELYGNLAGFAVAICFRLAECYGTRTLGWAMGYGAGFAQIPLAYFGLKVLILLGNGGIGRRQQAKFRFLQQMSILIFTLHYGMMELFRFVFRHWQLYKSNTTLQYVWVLAVTCLLAGGILWLSKKKGFRWLRYLY
jgi:hypothetical protein